MEEAKSMSNKNEVDLCGGFYLQRKDEPETRLKPDDIIGYRQPNYAYVSSGTEYRCGGNEPLKMKQLSLEPSEETWMRKPPPPPWVKVPLPLKVEATPDNERMPRVCPRFILENRTRWNRIDQEWEPILNKLVKPRRHCYKPSHCPFHRGYEQ